LNYSLIVNTQPSLYDFKELSLPVVRALRNLGVNAEFTGRNDLVIDGRKISGAAQMIKQGRLLHHGTLLFHSDLEMLQKVLTVKFDKIESKGIKSVRSRVTNICDHAPDLTIEGFKTELIRILQSEQDLTLEDLSREDDLGITALADSKYRTWDWNFGQSPEYNIRKDVRFNSGGMSIYLTVNKGIIESIHFYGDYFGDGDIEEIERALQNTKIQPEAVNQILLKIDIASYIHGLTADELTRFIVD
jgi:lipoate-protein ligase A